MSLETYLILVELFKNLQAIAPGLMIVSQHLGKCMFGEGTQVTGEGNATLFYHFQVCLHLKPLITGLSDQHFVKDDSESPNITLFRVEVVHIGFWRHVLGRSDVIEHLRLIRHLCHLAITEIDNCDALADFWPRLKEHIVRLEIAVHYALTSDLTIALKDLPEEEDCLFFRHSIWTALHVL